MSSEPTLGDLGERHIIESVLRSRYPGIGDDCAALPGGSEPGDLVATTDSCPTPLVALLGDRDPYHAGWLLAAINLSDLAAAGARPLGLLTNYTLPASTTVADFERLLAGVDDCCTEHGTRVVGGDLRDGDPSTLSATAIGRCVPGRRLRRSGARPGDRLLLIGHPGFLWASALLTTTWPPPPAASDPPPAAGELPLGDREPPPGDGAPPLGDREPPAAGRAWPAAGREAPVLDECLRAELQRRSRRPAPQLAAGRILASEGLASACLDVSDGLYPAVRALCHANGLGAALHTDVALEPAPAAVCAAAGLPPFALAQAWGDWNLLAAVPPDLAGPATGKLRSAASHVIDVGALTPPHGGITLDGTAWHGPDQERFSPRSWHGGDLPAWSRRILDLRPGPARGDGP